MLSTFDVLTKKTRAFQTIPADGMVMSSNAAKIEALEAQLAEANRKLERTTIRNPVHLVVEEACKDDTFHTLRGPNLSLQVSVEIAPVA
jgi:hypothetical protein